MAVRITRTGRVYASFQREDDVPSLALPQQQLATSLDLSQELRRALEREFAEATEDGNDEWEDVELSLDPLPALDEFSPLPSFPNTPPPTPTISPPGTPERSRPSTPLNGPSRKVVVIETTTRKQNRTACGTFAAGFTGPPSAAQSEHQKYRAKQAKKARVARKKAALRTAGRQYADAFTYKLRPSLSEKYQEAEILRTELDIHDLPHASTTYIGRQEPSGDSGLTVEELEAQGFVRYGWDGLRSVIITDKRDRAMATLAGRPDDLTWLPSMSRLQNKVAEAAKKLRFDKGQTLPAPSRAKGKKRRQGKNRRGDFKTASVGISFGGGQRKPGNLKHSEHNQTVLDDLLRDDDMKRLAGYGSSVLAFYAPKIYAYIRRNMSRLLRHDPRLRRNFRGSIFPAMSINFGPSTVTAEHVDHANLAGGLCIIHSGGNYDPKKGGQLYIRELRLIIEFPPYSTIAFPSAMFKHGNVPIQEGETRFSITQYAAGGLFRWVDYGFKTWKIIEKNEPDFARELREGHEDRWKAAVRRFSKVSELHKDRMKVFHGQ